jgi:hypothetical protein
MKTKTITIIGLILGAVFSRLIPHPWNLTAVGAVALFSGAYLRPKALSYLVPVAAFFVSDLILGFHQTMVFTYGALVITTALSIYFLSNSAKPLKVGALSVSSSVLFFVISNLGVWLAGGLYPMTGEGLANCFVMALPFFPAQLIGDLVYSAVMFGAYAWLAERAQWNTESASEIKSA